VQNLIYKYGTLSIKPNKKNTKKGVLKELLLIKHKYFTGKLKSIKG